MAHDPSVHMAGLVLGITVRPRTGTPDAVRGPARRMHLFVQEGARQGRAPRALGFVLQRGSSPPAADSVEIAGSTLVLTRGEPTDVTIHNRLKETTAVHWHGIELESFSDGVAGWSGAGGRLAPSIQPGDSFTARLTLPRAGTFMYHTHMNDIEQLTSGLYGGIVVLEPGQSFDAARDHLFVAGWDGAAEPPHVLVNGDSLPAQAVLAAGVGHRFRFVNIGVVGGIRPRIMRDSTVLEWRLVAKDGADVPATQATFRPGGQRLQVGETWDFEWIPAPGKYRLVMPGDGTPIVIQHITVH